MARTALFTSMVGSAAPKREQRHQRDQRNGRQVLEQQHREGEPAVAGGELALLLEHLQRERGRRQRQRKPDEQRLRRSETEREADRGEHQRGGDELGRAETENRRAQGPQPDRAKLEPDHEQQHDHAELAELENGIDVVQRVERSEHIGPDDDAGGEIAEHGAHAQGPAERRGDDGGGEKHRHLNQLRRDHGSTSTSAILA